MHNGSWVSFCVGQWVMGHACDALFTLVGILAYVRVEAFSDRLIAVDI